MVVNKKSSSDPVIGNLVKAVNNELSDKKLEHNDNKNDLSKSKEFDDVIS